MLRGYEANCTETSRTMRAMSPRVRRRARAGGCITVALLMAACSSATGVTTESANPAGSTAPASTSAPPSTVAPPTSSSSTESTDSTESTGSTGSTEVTAPPASSSASSPETTVATPFPGPPGTSINWQRVDDQHPQLEVGTLAVPVDYNDPSRGTFRLFLVRRLANDQDRKIGTLLVNPGGPGGSGAELAAGADFKFDKALLDRFDIVGWDPRGVGYTRPAIDCISDYDAYFGGYDITPDTPAVRQQDTATQKDFEDRCINQNSAILQHVGTNDAARDMDSIRRALGEDKISYFGFSYGSELGATWATLFPDTVRAAVLDGAADPNADLAEGSKQQAAGFENSLGLYLEACAKDSDCAFHNDGHPTEAFDALMASLDAHPIPSKPGRPDITRGMALGAVGQAMYDSSLWTQLSKALADAQKGDGAHLLVLWDDYYRRLPDGTWPNLLEAFQVIECMDNTDRPTIEQADALAAEVREVAPRMDPNTIGDYSCTWFPPTQSPRIPVTGKGAGPIVVVGTTGDPATPLASTEAMATTLEDGRLIIVTADQHTGYGGNDCVDNAVDDYLVDLEVPPQRTEC
jgi:pimeloyl-ACP methyl ester carboxylesterase